MPTKGERREFERLKALFEPAAPAAAAPKRSRSKDDDGDSVIVLSGKRTVDRFLDSLTGGTPFEPDDQDDDDDDDQDDDDQDDDDQDDDVEPDPAPAPRNRFFASRSRG